MNLTNLDLFQCPAQSQDWPLLHHHHPLHRALGSQKNKMMNKLGKSLKENSTNYYTIPCTVKQHKTVLWIKYKMCVQKNKQRKKESINHLANKWWSLGNFNLNMQWVHMTKCRNKQMVLVVKHMQVFKFTHNQMDWAQNQQLLRRFGM